MGRETGMDAFASSAGLGDEIGGEFAFEWVGGWGRHRVGGGGACLFSFEFALFALGGAADGSWRHSDGLSVETVARRVRTGDLKVRHPRERIGKKRSRKFVTGLDRGVLCDFAFVAPEQEVRAEIDRLLSAGWTAGRCCPHRGGVEWCKANAIMVRRSERDGKRSGAQPRASVSFPPELYKTIDDLAKRKKVSIAWIVRDAVEKYVADEWPLLAPLKGK
jgi:hypothetical protein